MAAPILLAAAVVGAGVSFAANRKAAKAAQKAAQDQAKLYERQAELIEENAEASIKQTRFQGQKLEGQQVVAYAASGVDISSGSALSVMGDTARQINDQIFNIRREAQFQTEMARTGADNILSSANDARKAASIANYGQAASSIASAGANYGKWAAATDTAENTTKLREFKEAEIKHKKVKRVNAQAQITVLQDTLIKEKNNPKLTPERRRMLEEAIERKRQLFLRDN